MNSCAADFGAGRGEDSPVGDKEILIVNVKSAEPYESCMVRSNFHRRRIAAAFDYLQSSSLLFVSLGCWTLLSVEVLLWIGINFK
jgi:hypothetical protein